MTQPTLKTVKRMKLVTEGISYQSDVYGPTTELNDSVAEACDNIEDEGGTILSFQALSFGARTGDLIKDNNSSQIGLSVMITYEIEIPV